MIKNLESYLSLNNNFLTSHDWFKQSSEINTWGWCSEGGILVLKAQIIKWKGFLTLDEDNPTINELQKTRIIAKKSFSYKIYITIMPYIAFFNIFGIQYDQSDKW